VNLAVRTRAKPAAKAHIQEKFARKIPSLLELRWLTRSARRIRVGPRPPSVRPPRLLPPPRPSPRASRVLRYRGGVRRQPLPCEFSPQTCTSLPPAAGTPPPPPPARRRRRRRLGGLGASAAAGAPGPAAMSPGPAPVRETCMAAAGSGAPPPRAGRIASGLLAVCSVLIPDSVGMPCCIRANSAAGVLLLLLALLGCCWRWPAAAGVLTRQRECSCCCWRCRPSGSVA
jgi:hypothetical protein